MPRDEQRAGSRHKRPARRDQHPAKDTDPRSCATVAQGFMPVTCLDDWRELRSWAAAVEYLNARGLVAAVPSSVAPVLRRRGLAVWAASDREAA